MLIIVPAKGKSRRAPLKNLQLIPKVLKEITIWSVIVSTDDPYIAYEAGKHGAGITRRPLGHMLEDATVEDVIHQYMSVYNIRPVRFGVVLPTAALILADDLIAASRLLRGRIDTVFGVARHRQDDVTCFADCGAFVLCKTRAFMKRQSFYDSKNIAIYVLPFSRGQDVDTQEDIARVDALLR